ncbi:MAG TPA: M20 family metallopeptidase [Thermodesulfobacteriota bacterium]
MSDPVLAELARREAEMVEMLGRLVSIDSGSYDKAGVDAVGAVLRGFLEAEGVACRVLPHPTLGDCLIATVGAGRGTALLMGHRDTVFPPGTAAERPFRVADGVATGPGVADMKAGLVMNAFVLAAFARAGTPVPLVGLFSADEEIGSPASRPIIEAEARRARAVFNAEPGRPSGNVVVRRKGAAFLEVQVEGRAVHSGVEPQNGASAIEALARKITRLHALTDYEAGVTVNVGLVRGGTAVNVVAAEARAEVDVRYPTPEAMARVLGEVRTIVEAVDVPGTRARLVERATFVPLVPTGASTRLFDLYARCAADVGLTLEGEASGGSADSGFAAAVGAPTLCGTGPVGGNPHRPDEFCRVGTLVPRAQALALTILRLGRAA